MKALSIKQPWAWLIAHGFKDVENRTWRTKFRGRFLIHAPIQIDQKFAQDLYCWSMMADDPTGFLRPSSEVLQRLLSIYPKDPAKLPVGGIVGEAEIVDCIDKMDSPWFTGPHGFVLADPKPLPFMACKGKLNFFDPVFRARIT